MADALASDLRSRPGSRYYYSNVGYSLLAAIIEESSGQGYQAYLAEHLFAAAGMTRTGFVLPDWERDGVALEYDAAGRPQGHPFDHPWAEDGPSWHLRGNGWSYGEIARSESGAFTFWVTNQSRSEPGGWDLERTGPQLTQRMLERLLTGE